MLDPQQFQTETIFEFLNDRIEIVWQIFDKPELMNLKLTTKFPYFDSINSTKTVSFAIALHEL